LAELPLFYLALRRSPVPPFLPPLWKGEGFVLTCSTISSILWARFFSLLFPPIAARHRPYPFSAKRKTCGRADDLYFFPPPGEIYLLSFFCEREEPWALFFGIRESRPAVGRFFLLLRSVRLSSLFSAECRRAPRPPPPPESESAGSGRTRILSGPFVRSHKGLPFFSSSSPWFKTFAPSEGFLFLPKCPLSFPLWGRIVRFFLPPPSLGAHV